MSQVQIQPPKNNNSDQVFSTMVKLRESVVLGTVTDVEKLDAVVNSSVDVLKEKIIVVDDFNRKTLFDYWLDTDSLIALNYSDDQKTLYVLVVTADKTLMLLVFDVIQ